jgi:hypothetical protein
MFLIDSDFAETKRTDQGAASNIVGEHARE